MEFSSFLSIIGDIGAVSPRFFDFCGLLSEHKEKSKNLLKTSPKVVKVGVQFPDLLLFLHYFLGFGRVSL